MFDLRRWTGDVDAGPFRFGDTPARLEVTVRHEVVEPSDDGPRPTGERTTRRYVNGELVAEEVLPEQGAEGT